MKKLKLLSLLIFPCVLIMTSCGSIQYGKDGGAKTVKMPFSEEDYVDNSTYVYSIQSTRGTGSKSAIKSATPNLTLLSTAPSNSTIVAEIFCSVR